LAMNFYQNAKSRGVVLMHIGTPENGRIRVTFIGVDSGDGFKSDKAFEEEWGDMVGEQGEKLKALHGRGINLMKLTAVDESGGSFRLDSFVADSEGHPRGRSVWIPKPGKKEVFVYSGSAIKQGTTFTAHVYLVPAGSSDKKEEAAVEDKPARDISSHPA